MAEIPWDELTDEEIDDILMQMVDEDDGFGDFFGGPEDEDDYPVLPDPPPLDPDGGGGAGGGFTNPFGIDFTLPTLDKLDKLPAREPAFTNEEVRSMRLRAIELAEAAAARAAVRFGWAIEDREKAKELLAIRLQRQMEADERAKRAAERAEIGLQQRLQAPFIRQPKPLPPPKEVTEKSPIPQSALNWRTLSKLIPKSDLESLISAWESGSEGLGHISHLRARRLLAMLPLADTVPELITLLHILWASSQGGSRSSAPVKGSAPSTRAPRPVRIAPPQGPRTTGLGTLSAGGLPELNPPPTTSVPESGLF